MSQISGTYSGSSTKNLKRRTVAEIQRNVTKQSRRNAASRLLHANNDKEAIAAWKLDLNRILHIFNVCVVIHIRLVLTARLQTELAVTTHLVVSDVHHGVVDTHTMVSDMHRNMLKGLESSDDQYHLVSDVCTPLHHSMNDGHGRLDAGQVSYLD